MSRTLKIGYLLLGFTVGYSYGVMPGHDPISALQVLGYFAGASILFGIVVWFERNSHRRHLEQWEQLAQQGKWSFIFTRYILARGIVILLLVFVPFTVKFSMRAAPILALSLTAIMGLSIMAFHGYQEWLECDQDFRVRALREAAERAKQ